MDGKKPQVVIEKHDEMPSLEETGRQDELKQRYCSLRKKKKRKKLFQMKVNGCVLNNHKRMSLKVD